MVLKNGWLDDYTWFNLMQRPSGYWTKERVVEESRKYKTRGEFHDNNGTAYSKARINGWLDELTWLKDERIDFSTDKIDCVYAYEFREFNSVYVGRTLLRRVKDRDKEHLFVDKDTVSLFVKKHDIPIPDMKVLEDNLTIAEGVEKENYYIKQYQKEGWQIINRAKAGSIGLLAKNKWSKKTCYEEALKYKSRTDFSKHGGGAYEIARQNGWLDDYVWFEEKIKKHGFWHDYKNCYNAARKCSDVTEFIKEYGPAYINAKKNDWLKDYTWFRAPLRVRKWTYDKCKELAKTVRGRDDFAKKYGERASSTCRKNNWFDEFFPQEK